jgi:NitT/TauT family transport system substrate-binding protein
MIWSEKIIHRLGSWCLAPIAALAIVQGTVAQPLEKMTYALNWTPDSGHIGYWVALEKGYYAKRGVDVDLQFSTGSGDALAKVDTGRAQMGLVDALVMFPAVARGSKVKIVAIVYDISPFNIYTRRDSGIKVPKDLEGKTIGASPGNTQRVLFPAFAKLAGIDSSKVEWVNISPTAGPSALLAKRVDAVALFTTQMPVMEKILGKGNVHTMPWADYGLDAYSLSTIVADDFLKKKPEAVRGFLTASAEGWRDVFANLDESLAIYKKRVPEIDVDVVRTTLQQAIFGLMKSKRFVEHGIGWIDREKMCASVKLANDNLGLSRPVACDEVYSDKYLTRVDLPK